MVVADETNTIVWANRAASQLVGWPDHDLVGQPLTTLMPERFREMHMAGFERYVATREPTIMGRPVRVPALRRDGTEVPIELVLNPLPSDSNAMVAASLRSMEDRVELELRSVVVSRLLGVLAQGGALTDVAPRVLEAIADSLGWQYAGLWVVDWNEELVRLASWWAAADVSLPNFTAVSEERTFRVGEGVPGRVAATGEPLWIPDIDKSTTFPRREPALADGLQSALAFPVRSGRRMLGAIELLTTAVRAPDEQLLEAMAAIGEHLGRFLEQRLAEEAVQASRHRLELALEAGRLGTWEWDLRADVLHWFDNLEEAVGQSGPQGRPFDQALDLVHAEDRAEVERCFRDAAAGHGDLRCTYRVIDMDGQVRWFETSGRLMRDAAGRTLLAGVAGDVTERMEAEQHREALLREVQAAESRLAILAEGGELLASSLDYQETLGHVASLSVPRLADWCLVHGIRENGSLHLLAAEPGGPAAGVLNQLHHPRAVPHLFGLGEVIASGRPVLYEEVTPALLRALAVDGAHLASLEALGWRSVLVVPLQARGRTLGAITWAMGESGRAYTTDDLDFAGQLAARAALAVDNARLYEDQANTARTLQESLLPPHLPSIPGIEVAAAYRPAGRNQVAGDFYDLFPLRGDSWGIVVGDVRGKGAAAAAVTALARWTVRAAAMQASSPPRVLSLLNDAMVRRLEEGEDPRFCTAVFARLRAADDGAQLTVSSGGHPLPLLLRRSGGVQELGEAGLIVGAFAQGDWTPAKAHLGPGDVVLLYTDGVTEARLGAEELFGDERLRGLLEECAGLTAAEVVEQVLKRLEDETDPRDDVALLALRVRE